MKNFLTRFFATEEELLMLIKSIAEDFDLHISLLYASPYLISKVDNIYGINFDKVKSIYFTKDEPDDGTKKIGEFKSEHSFFIKLYLGHFNDEVLTESNLSYSTDDSNSLNLGHQVTAMIKERMIFDNEYYEERNVFSYEDSYMDFNKKIDESKGILYTPSVTYLYGKGIKLQRSFKGKNHFVLINEYKDL